MSRLIAARGAPEHTRSNNGSVSRGLQRHAKSFIEKEQRAWLASQSIQTLYIDPGRAWEMVSLGASMLGYGTSASTLRYSTL